MKNKLRMRISESFDMFGFNVWMYERTDDLDGNNKTSIVETITMKALDDDATIIPPTMVLQKDELQAMMDTLWQAGIRPSNGEGSIGQIGAVKDHLEDMRAIARNAGIMAV